MTLGGTQKYELHVSFNYNWLQIHYPGYFYIYQKILTLLVWLGFSIFKTQHNLMNDMKVSDKPH